MPPSQRTAYVDERAFTGEQDCVVLFLLKPLEFDPKANALVGCRDPPSGLHHLEQCCVSPEPICFECSGSTDVVHQFSSAFGYEILCKPPYISGVEREVIDDLAWVQVVRPSGRKENGSALKHAHRWNRCYNK